MVDSIIAILLSILLIEFARFGGHVSANPPPNPAIAKKYTWRFRGYALAAAILAIAQGARLYKASVESQRVQTSLNSSIANLNSEIQRSDTARQVDNAYLKAKLEDAYKVNQQLTGLAPALLKMAQVSADYSKKQYETKVLSDKKLLDFTAAVVTKIRGVQSGCDIGYQKAESIISALPAEPMSEEQRSQFFANRQRQYINAYQQNLSECELAFRSTVLGDAAYARRELLSRIGGDGFLLPRERSRGIAIDGVFAGVRPVGDAADYLETLAKKLSQSN